MRDFRKLNESFRSFIKRDDSRDSEKRGDDPNYMGTPLNSRYMEEERMLWEVTDDEMKAIKKFLGPENADKLSFSNLFGENNLRIAIPFPTEAQNESPIVQLHNFFSNIGWQVELSNGTVEKEEITKRPDTGEEVSRKKSVRIGKMLKKLNSLLEKYHDMSLSGVQEETRGFEQYFKEHGVSGEEVFKMLHAKIENNIGLSRATERSFWDFEDAGFFNGAIENILQEISSFSDFYAFQESFLNNSKSEFKNAGFALSMDMATAFSNLNQDILNAYLTIKASNFDRDNRQAAKARLEIKREVRERLRSQLESVKSKRAEFSDKFRKDFYLTPWQFDPSQVVTLLQFWNEKSEFYVNNPDALTESKYSIIISRSPIDVLRMSDFKNIESCHSPKSRGQGSYWQCAVAEARGQGLVAYVVEAKDLEKVDLNADEVFEDDKRGVDGIVPLARVRLRKYGLQSMAPDGGTAFIAVPEQRTYGMRFPKLYKAVLDWSKDTQINDKINYHRVSSTIDDQTGKGIIRYGGSYQDTPDAELINGFFGDHVLSPYVSIDTDETETDIHSDLVDKLTAAADAITSKVNKAFKKIFNQEGVEILVKTEVRPELPDRPLLYFISGHIEYDDERRTSIDLYLDYKKRSHLENEIQHAVVERMRSVSGNESHPIDKFQVELFHDRVVIYRQGANIRSQIYTYDIDGLKNYVEMVVPDFLKSDIVRIVDNVLLSHGLIYPRQMPSGMDIGEFKDLVQKIKGPKPDSMSWGQYFMELPDMNIDKSKYKAKEEEPTGIDWRDYVRQAKDLQQRYDQRQQDRPIEPEKDDDEEKINEISSLVDSLMSLSGKTNLLRELTDDEYTRVSHIVRDINPKHLSFNDIFGDKKRLVMPFVPGPTGELADILEMMQEIGAKLNVEDGTIEKEITSVRKDTGEEVKSVRKIKINKFFNKALEAQKKLQKLTSDYRNIEKENPPSDDPGSKKEYNDKLNRITNQRNDLMQKARKEFGKLGINVYFEPEIKKWMKFWQEKGEYYRQNPKAIEGETGKYSLVITRAPIDVLRMSDFDDITSCHSPSSRGSGGYYHCAVEEARGHGPIAYVVENEDIEKIGLDLQGESEDWQSEEVFVDRARARSGIEPLSRVRIRKYVHDDSDVAIAVPETSTYGKRFPNLVSSVQDFFRKKQQRKMLELQSETDLNDYTRFGGSYADSSDDDLFNDFFLTEDFVGSADIDSGDESEEDEADLYQEYIDEAQNVQDEADRNLEHSTVYHDVEENNGEPYVYYSANAKIELDYEIDTSGWASFEIEKEIREVLYGIVGANIEDVNFEEYRGEASILIDFSNYEYASDPQGFHDFYYHDILKGFDEEYDSIYREIKKALAKMGIVDFNKKDEYFAKVANAYKQEYNENMFKHFVASFDLDNETLEFSSKGSSAIPIDASLFVAGGREVNSQDKYAKGVKLAKYSAVEDLRKTIEAKGFEKDIWNVLLELFNQRIKQPLLPGIPPNASDFDLNVEFPLNFFRFQIEENPYKLPNNEWIAKLNITASFVGVIDDEDFILAMQLIEFLDNNYEKLVRVVQKALPEHVTGVNQAMATLSSIMEISKLASSIINEIEPFQKDTIKKHPKRKKMTIGLGGNKSTGGGPFKKKPSMKKNKSAPPGAGGA